jgi:Xaa-Pro aminopeptidase
LLAALGERELSAALVTDLFNVRYLTGFTGSSGALLVLADGRAWLATDGRYDTQAAEQSPDVERVISRQGPEQLLVIARRETSGAVGFEDGSMPTAEQRRLSKDFGELSAVGSMVGELRLSKDGLELDLLRQACTITDEALAAVLPRLRPGVSERQIGRWLDDAIRDRTYEGPGFSTIVATGANSAIPHHEPTDQQVAAGDFVKMDFGARVDGYHADMTRTVVVGQEPADWQRDIYSLVQQAQEAGRLALSASATGVTVDEAARSVVEQAGMGEYFTHGLGHGVGLQIHEAPYLGSTSTDRLAPAVPVTVEPGVYLPGRGGVRIEDTTVVHQDRVELLTTSTRELLVLD